MIRFLITVKHDDGMIDITTHATDADSARQIVMAAEGCPGRAIRRVRAVSADGYELQADKLDKYRTLRVTAGQIHTVTPGGRNLPDKIPTCFEVHGPYDSRWRRVYSTRHTGVRYIILGGLKVMVELPKDMP